MVQRREQSNGNANCLTLSHSNRDSRTRTVWFGRKECPEFGEIRVGSRGYLDPCAFEGGSLQIGRHAVAPELPSGPPDAPALMEKSLLVTEVKVMIELVKVL